MCPDQDDQGVVHVASLQGLARATTAAAVAMAAAIVVFILLSGFTAFVAFLGVLCLVSLAGSALFCGFQRTAAVASEAVNGERVLAQGVGRGGRGFLGGHVVAVTEKSILSISVRPWGTGRKTDEIFLSEISGIKSGSDFLDITDGRTKIRLKKSPPPQVAAILGELHRYVDTI